VAGEYLVAFKNPFVMQPMAAQMRSMGAEVTDMWESIQGAAVRLSPDQLDAVLRMDGVAWVEESSMYYITAAQSRTIPANLRGDRGLYGLDRINQTIPLAQGSGLFSAPSDGTGVDVYVIDTGIRPTHTQFQGKFLRGANFINDGQINDCNLHGTHVSGTATGLTFGVAPAAIIRDVRVFSCQGSTTNQAIIQGVNYVAQQATQRRRPSVANMSLGGGASPMLDNAVNNLARAGVFVAVAAGNSNANAATISRARAAGAFAVGSSTFTDTRSGFSNFGTTVKLFAPGSNILSADRNSDNGTLVISGTSMASPHVAGAAALLLDLDPTLSPGAVGNALVQNATRNALRGNLGAGSPNLLLNVNPQ